MKAVEVIMIPVADQQKAKEFYLQLGFELIADNDMGNGERWVQVGLPGGGTTLSLAKFHGIIIETADIEKDVNGFKEKGAEPGNIDNTPWGKFCWLKDIDGNGLCLHQK